jgi:ribonuclease J
MVHRTINRLFQRGAEVIYDSILPVHVSGHANQDEMKLLLQLIRPKYFIPVHGELRHLKQHAALAREIGIPEEQIAVVENGTMIEFSNGNMKIGERIPGGYIFVDGSGVGDIGPKVMRERETLAREGIVIVQVNLERDKKRVIGEPKIISKGFVFVRDAADLFDEARELVLEVVERGSGKGLEERLENELSRFFYAETKRRPMIFTFISRNG